VLLRKIDVGHVKKKADYTEVFPVDLEKALPLIHYLEATVSQLPIGAKIPQTEFRRVVSTSLASIASFIAFAVYDEMSFHCLSVLLMKQSGESIPNQVESLQVHNLRHLAKETAADQQYLFSNEMLDYGLDFVTNVVSVMTHFADALKELQRDDPFRCDTLKKVYQLGRMQGHLFRTLASDVVEIYVKHGCFPRRTKDCQKHHPLLIEWMAKRDIISKKPVPLIFEYFILAMAQKKVQVASSHVYNTSRKMIHTKRDGEIVAPPLAPDDARRATEKKRTTTRTIRYYYKLVGDPTDSEAESEWLTLPEVFNVILFGLTNPWGNHEKIDWVPNLRKSTKFWVKPKSEPKEGSEKKKATKTTPKRGVTGGKARLEGKTREEEEEAKVSEDESEDGSEDKKAKEKADKPERASSDSPSHHDPTLGIAQGRVDDSEYGGDEESDNEVEKAGQKTTGLYDVIEDRKDEEVPESASLARLGIDGQPDLKELAHEKFVEVSNIVLQVINMGDDGVDSSYPQILESIKSMCMTLELLTRMQLSLMRVGKQMTVSKRDDGTVDISDALSEIQNFFPDFSIRTSEAPIKYVERDIDESNGFDVIERKDVADDQAAARIINTQPAPFGGKSKFSFDMTDIPQGQEIVGEGP
jgi:hypothetical protein